MAKSQNIDAEAKTTIKRWRVTEMQISRQELARRLGVAASSVSNWELGQNEPSRQVYQELATISAGASRDWFLKKAGLSEPFLIALSSGSAPEGTKSLRTHDSILVPLYKEAVAAGEARQIDESEIMEMIPLARRWVPSGADLKAFHVIGDSMYPVLQSGFVVIVDFSQREKERLIGRMVAVRDESGVTIKWLTKDADVYMLEPEQRSSSFKAKVIREGDDLSILGVVLKWIGQPPIRK